MTTVLNVILFLFGMCLCVQVIAAFYSIIDLWYCIGTEYTRVIRSILVWCAPTVTVAWLLGDRFRPAFLWGLGAYVVLYLLVYAGFRVFPIRNRRLLEGD